MRVRDDETWHLPTTVLELREENEIYLVAPALRDALADLIVPKMLYPTISRQGVVFIWPVGLPDHTGRTHRAHASARDAAEHARKAWVRLQWDPYLGGYRLHEARSEFGAPEWPEVTAEELIQLAFRDRYIDSLEHPAIKRLRGELYLSDSGPGEFATRRVRARRGNPSDFAIWSPFPGLGVGRGLS